jgi:hypothetical protein
MSFVLPGINDLGVIVVPDIVYEGKITLADISAFLNYYSKFNWVEFSLAVIILK